MIYLVEDDSNIREFVLYALNGQGFEARGFEKPSLFWAALEEQVPALLLLDIMLPEEDGLSILRKIRSASATKRMPVILLTAKDTEFDKVIGLDIGADDYITKPFRPRELISRIRSVLRRTGKGRRQITIRDLTVDTEKGTVTKAGEELFLSALEYRLLLVFLNSRGQILSRSRLLEEIWDNAGDFVSDNTLTVYIKRLRDKIETDPSQPDLIKTVRGLGYRLEG